MKNFLLPEDLGQIIMNYLSERPYKEVALMIEGLNQVQTAPEPAPPEPAPAPPEPETGQMAACSKEGCPKEDCPDCSAVVPNTDASE